ncbi:MAG: hypothetical protein IJM84_04330, partial [Bacteroidaceae bacterium]|nr:hypothetical protein [Bacteroidaceae bacterium]
SHCFVFDYQCRICEILKASKPKRPENAFVCMVFHPIVQTSIMNAYLYGTAYKSNYFYKNKRIAYIFFVKKLE